MIYSQSSFEECSTKVEILRAYWLTGDCTLCRCIMNSMVYAHLFFILGCIAFHPLYELGKLCFWPSLISFVHFVFMDVMVYKNWDEFILNMDDGTTEALDHGNCTTVKQYLCASCKWLRVVNDFLSLELLWVRKILKFAFMLQKNRGDGIRAGYIREHKMQIFLLLCSDRCRKCDHIITTSAWTFPKHDVYTIYNTVKVYPRVPFVISEVEIFSCHVLN